MTQRHEVDKCCWKYGADRLAQHRVATNFQFEKNAVSAKLNTAKQYKMRFICCYPQNNKKNKIKAS